MPMKAKPKEILIEFADGRGRYPWSQTPFARHEAELLRAATTSVRLPRQPGESKDDHAIRREVATEDRFLALCRKKLGTAAIDSVMLTEDCVIASSFLRRSDFECLYQMEASL